MPLTNLVNRAGPGHVALETTLLLHGVPKESGSPLASELAGIVRNHGAAPAFVGLHHGVPIAGLNDSELSDLFRAARVPKANTANLGLLMHARSHAATTVSTTLEIAAAAGIRIFATGGLGGVHHGLGECIDISADLAALSRFPVAVVTSGVKSILNVESSRELLETLGVPVVGFRTDRFPAFYLRESGAIVDARIDDPASLATFIRDELARTGRGIVVANPIPVEHEIPASQWEVWLAAAQQQTQATAPLGRDATPRILSALHQLSDGRTLAANLSLIRANAVLAAQIARIMSGPDPARA